MFKFTKILKNTIWWWLFLFFWELFYQLNFLNLSFFSSPSRIFFVWLSPEFWSNLSQDIQFTLARLIIGLFLGILLSYLILFIAITIPGMLRFSRQINIVFRYFPIPAIIPIGILIFGLGDLSKIFVVVFTTILIYFNYFLDILNKDESIFYDLQRIYKINFWKRFKSFLVPITSLLSYRVNSLAITWSMGMAILTEVIIGGDSGLGSKMLRFQQLFLPDLLYSVLLIIIVIGIILERATIYSFCRLKWDKIKTTTTTFLIFLVIISGVFLMQANYKNLIFLRGKSIATYSAVINLPIMVFLEKYDEKQMFYLELTSSSNIALNNLLANKTDVSGFNDLPNVIAGNQKNSNVKILAQVEETPKQPTLFFITRNQLATEKNFQPLNNSKISYYPDSQIVLSGLDYSINYKRGNTKTINFTTSSDPESLVQGFISRQIESSLTIEPYITRMEKQTGLNRMSNQSLIEGLDFDYLPLAGLVIDEKDLTKEEKVYLEEGIQKSIDFIKKNTNDNNQAKEELQKIMEKYDLDKNSYIPRFNNNKDEMITNSQLLLDLLKLVAKDTVQNINYKDIKNWYY